MVKLNPGLSQILSKIFLTKNMSLELTKYCFLFTTRLNDDNIEYYSKQCKGRKIQKWNRIFNPWLVLISLSWTWAWNFKNSIVKGTMSQGFIAVWGQQTFVTWRQFYLRRFKKLVYAWLASNKGLFCAEVITSCLYPYAKCPCTIMKKMSDKLISLGST